MILFSDGYQNLKTNKKYPTSLSQSFKNNWKEKYKWKGSLEIRNVSKKKFLSWKTKVVNYFLGHHQSFKKLQFKDKSDVSTKFKWFEMISPFISEVTLINLFKKFKQFFFSINSNKKYFLTEFSPETKAENESETITLTEL